MSKESRTIISIKAKIEPPFFRKEDMRGKKGITIALQKSGELSNIALITLSQILNRSIPKEPNDRKFFVKNGDDNLVFARNSDIVHLVNSGAADIAVIGIDRLIEEGFGHLVGIQTQNIDTNILIIKCLETLQPWRIVLATKQKLLDLRQISQIATSYPIIAQVFFNTLSQDINLISVNGSTEAMINLKFNNAPIDAIIDLTVSGKTLKANGLIPWKNDILHIYPVVIANKQFLQSL
ncbi:MAG: ATP phosphoribosyltransferase [Pseudomonadales bacterium]|nr:ATP phosphoribosyltransferase [Pseudomonadales bacterium]